jgi:putative FmdB family regulatory protein
MPIYEYRCKSCGNVVEVIQRIGDRPLRKCRECSGRMEKLVSRAAFILKGGGWFAEGYSKGGEPASKSKKANLAKDSSSKPKKESKPKQSAD